MILRWLERTNLPVVVPGLVPETFQALTLTDAARQPARVGNQAVELGELAEFAASIENVLTLEGDWSHVRGIGRAMRSGTLQIRGNAGAFAGEGLLGGRLEVHGSVGDYAGAGMMGGVLHVRGCAGDFLGGSRPGARLGMKEGRIVVEGDAGDGVGRRMRRGLIAIAGKVGEGLGEDLVAGSIFALGQVGRFAGLGMKRGTIAVLNGEGFEPLPTFAPSGRYRFPFLSVYLRELRAQGFPVPPEVLSAELERYNGDLADGGRGEILVLPGA